MEVRSLEGLYVEIQSFKSKTNYQDSEIVVIMNTKYKPIGFMPKKKTIFGIELLFSPHIHQVLVAKKINEKFLGL